MPVIGVGGEIASGKTTVCKLFERWGAIIIDADVIGKQVVEKDAALLKKLVETFGQDIVDPLGNLDRRRLGKIVFANELSRKKLNEIVHPALLSELENQVRKWISSNPKTILVIDAALLFDWELGSLLDVMIVVKSTRKQRLERMVHYVGLTSEEAEDRISAQSHLESKSAQADYSITNNGHINDLERQAKEVWEKILQHSKHNIQNSKGLSNDYR